MTFTLADLLDSLPPGDPRRSLVLGRVREQGPQPKREPVQAGAQRASAPGVSGAIRLTLPYPPTTNTLFATVNGRRVLSREGRAYKARVAAIATEASTQPLAGDVVLRLSVYRPRRCGDLSNRIKVLEDALKGFAWGDDAQVKRLEAERFEDKANPRVEVEVEAIERSEG